jgi:propionyl-CoA carboxylase alpha chain
VTAVTDQRVTCVLIANRGEIARRVVATCRRLGLAAVAVCSDPDLDAPHVREADVAVRLPGASAARTYLRADLLVDAALRAGADAVHPGYGFLAENAGFARAVVDAGLTWIGPSADAIAAMGDKVEAKRLAAAAGVPVLAGLAPDAVRADDLPVLVKAAAGGGGRGMRLVRDLAGLRAAIEAARDEAAAAFGDPTVFIEPFVERGHHVEVQVMADRHGTVLALGERECSIQRRHQKIIEESPSPLVGRTPGMRDRLRAAAIAVARAVGYTGAGTVEFLAVPDGRFWFLEMNTRLQVEHPVTECVTGLDLVELQFLVAAGGRLPERAALPRGAAIEARLYAEDPAAGWQPATGTLHRLEVPVSHPAFTPPALDAAPRGVRLDAGVEDGAVIGVHYDPMLAKVIAWAPTRAEAAAALARALIRARIHGLRTNRDLLVRVLGHPAFAVGDTDTGFLDRHGPDTLAAPLVGSADERLAAVAAALACAAGRRAAATVLAAVPGGWRNVPTSPQRTVLTGPAGEHRVSYRATRDGMTVEDPPGVAPLSWTPDTVVMEAGGLIRRWRVACYPGPDGAGPDSAGSDSGCRLEVDGDTGAVTFTEASRFPEPGQPGQPGQRGQHGEDGDEESLRAPLPGTVVALSVAVGDEVGAGQELLVIEAMKMRHVVRADRTGRVAALPARIGAAVEVGAVLAVLADDRPQEPHEHAEVRS